MEKALFHKDSNQPPLNPLLSKEGEKGWLIHLQHQITLVSNYFKYFPFRQLPEDGSTRSLSEKGEIISYRHNIRYSTNISGEFQQKHYLY